MVKEGKPPEKDPDPESKVPSLADYRSDDSIEVPESEVLTAGELLNIEVQFNAFTEQKSTMGRGTYLEVEIVVDGEIRIMTTGARGVVDKLKALRDKMPFRAYIIQRGQRFDLE